MNEFFILMKSELLVTIIIFTLLFVKIGKGMRNESLLVLIQTLLLLNFIAGFFYTGTGLLFDGMFTATTASILQKNILNLAVYLISLLFSQWFKEHEHMPEFFILMLSAVLGMFFLISAGNLLIFFLALELATIPVAAMVNFDMQKKTSSEAAMKMILSGAFSSGILLFGISLIYGVTGTINFAVLPSVVSQAPLMVLAFVFFITAFAFKLSIVPFHLWTADVYEGGPIASSAFLSVVSKGAVSFIFISVLYKVFQPMHEVWYHLIMVLSLCTIILGNIFALRQQNIKRFLAFSSIAQMGFILVGISANSGAGAVSVVYFILIYTFSNLAAFGVAAAIAWQTGKEKINDYKGLYKNNPFLSWIMALALFSLAGIPPTAGFFGKLFLISAGATTANYWYIIVVALNLIVSLFYYLKVVRAIFMDNNEQQIDKVFVPFPAKFAMVFCAAAIVTAGLLSWIWDYVQASIM